MNKKFYTAPNVDIVELQGEVVLTNGSNVNDASDPCGGMSLDPDNMRTVGNNRNLDSGAYFDVWEDE